MKERFLRSRWFEGLSRGGFVARGVVYGLVGAFAVALAAGAGGKATNQQGALATVARKPFGHVLLVLIAVGLGGYALWRFVRAALGRGPENNGDSAVDRVAGLASGCAYAFLCVAAVEILVGAGSHAKLNVSHKTAGILGRPGGRWIVASIGVVLVAVGLYQGFRGITRSFLDEAKVGKMHERTRRIVTAVGTVGHLARMIVFGLVGIFLVKAALDYNATTAVGIGGALSRVAHEPAGHALLGIVAVGLVAFGLYSVTDARYHRL